MKKENNIDNEFIVLIRVNTPSKKDAESLITALEPLLKKYQLVEIDKIVGHKNKIRSNKFRLVVVIFVLFVISFLFFM